MTWKILGGVFGSALPIPIYLALPLLDLIPGVMAIGLLIAIFGAWGGVNVGAKSPLAVVLGIVGWVAAIWVSEMFTPYPSYQYAGLLASGLVAGTRLGFWLDRRRH